MEKNLIKGSPIGAALKKKIDIYSLQTVPGGEYQYELGRVIKTHVNKSLKNKIEVWVRFDKNGKRYPVKTKIYVSDIESVKHRI